MFDYPLTKEEFFRYGWKLPAQSSFDRITDVLRELVKEGDIEIKHHFYFFPGRSKTVEIRREKAWILAQKHKKAQRAMRFIRWIPFLQAVFLCNQFEVSTRDESDIDFLIVTKPGRIWVARFFCILVLGIMRLRIQKKTRKSKICLSFFISSDALDFSKLSSRNDNVYFLYWIALLMPLYDPQQIFKKVMKENKHWLSEHIPHTSEYTHINERFMVSDGRLSKYIKSFFEKAWEGSYGDLIQSQLKEIQMKKIQAKGLKLNDPEHNIVVNDDMLKFHENDRRTLYYDRWQNSYQPK
ncbi:hypothetical protein H6758_03955 [Candidatus Nomurabacteria bacterium]|nr:hypothetical protein [Candidatus Nomurabacteria bacterium]